MQTATLMHHVEQKYGGFTSYQKLEKRRNQMKQHLYITQRRIVRTAICAAILVILVCSSAKASPCLSSIGRIPIFLRSTSALSACRGDNRVEPDLCPPRFTVRSPRMSIPMPTASS